MRVGVRGLTVFDGESARVTGAVGGALLPSDSGEAYKDGCSFADFVEERRFRVFRHVVRHLKISVRTGAFGVHNALGNALAIEMGDFVDVIGVLQQNRAERTRRQRVLIVRH